MSDERNSTTGWQAWWKPISTASQQSYETRYIDAAHDRAARAIARVLTDSGALRPGPALNCAMACLTRLQGEGLLVADGKMELWQR